MVQDEEDMCRKCGACSCGLGALLGVLLWLSLGGTLVMAFGLHESPIARSYFGGLQANLSWTN